jgi:hypothetical protein
MLRFLPNKPTIKVVIFETLSHVRREENIACKPFAVFVRKITAYNPVQL